MEKIQVVVAFDREDLDKALESLQEKLLLSGADKSMRLKAAEIAESLKKEDSRYTYIDLGELPSEIIAGEAIGAFILTHLARAKEGATRERYQEFKKKYGLE